MAEVDFTQDVNNGDFEENGAKAETNGNGENAEAPKVQLYFLECSKMGPRYNQNFLNRLSKMVMITYKLLCQSIFVSDFL